MREASFKDLEQQSFHTANHDESGLFQTKNITVPNLPDTQKYHDLFFKKSDEFLEDNDRSYEDGVKLLSKRYKGDKLEAELRELKEDYASDVTLLFEEKKELVAEHPHKEIPESGSVRDRIAVKHGIELGIFTKEEILTNYTSYFDIMTILKTYNDDLGRMNPNIQFIDTRPIRMISKQDYDDCSNYKLRPLFTDELQRVRDRTIEKETMFKYHTIDIAPFFTWKVMLATEEILTTITQNVNSWDVCHWRMSESPRRSSVVPQRPDWYASYEEIDSYHRSVHKAEAANAVMESIAEEGFIAA